MLLERLKKERLERKRISGGQPMRLNPKKKKDYESGKKEKKPESGFPHESWYRNAIIPTPESATDCRERMCDEMLERVAVMEKGYRKKP